MVVIHHFEEFEICSKCDSRSLPLPDNCVHLVVTSPPYNVTKEYDDDLSLLEYLGMLQEVFSECYRVLAPGGRMVVNVANLGRKPYIPLSSHINIIMYELGFLMRGEVIWDKSVAQDPHVLGVPSNQHQIHISGMFMNTC